jgi:hypothetical protein
VLRIPDGLSTTLFCATAPSPPYHPTEPEKPGCLLIKKIDIA